MGISLKLDDHSKEVLREFNTQIEAALEAVGDQAVSHAKQNITEAGRVDTGALRNSIMIIGWRNQSRIRVISLPNDKFGRE